jgi:hypothetical protein
LVLLIGSLSHSGRAGIEERLEIHTTRWRAANYIGPLVWIFVWMFDQTRVRGKNVLLWPVPFVLARRPPSCCSSCFCRGRGSCNLPSGISAA